MERSEDGPSCAAVQADAMKTALLARLLACSLAALPLVACAAEEEQAAEEEEIPAEAQAGELRSAQLAEADMTKIPNPPGMMRPWDQPDSTGWFGERGKCGQTALANLVGLYGVQLSPQEAEARGVYSVIGTRGTPIRNYLRDNHPGFGCSIQHPTDGPGYLRSHIRSGHPVLVWFNTAGFYTSHWVPAVGIVGSGADERVIVMSWGRYYSIPMNKLEEAWRNVYGMRRPSIVCTRPTRLVSTQTASR